MLFGCSLCTCFPSFPLSRKDNLEGVAVIWRNAFSHTGMFSFFVLFCFFAFCHWSFNAESHYCSPLFLSFHNPHLHVSITTSFPLPVLPVPRVPLTFFLFPPSSFMTFFSSGSAPILFVLPIHLYIFFFLLLWFVSLLPAPLPPLSPSPQACKPNHSAEGGGSGQSLPPHVGSLGQADDQSCPAKRRKASGPAKVNMAVVSLVVSRVYSELNWGGRGGNSSFIHLNTASFCFFTSGWFMGQ